MTWIKLTDFKPPTHEIILFRDIHGNEHYGVLCSDLSKKEHRNKFWCHLAQKSYNQHDITYWCEIPINKHLLNRHIEMCENVNSFLYKEFSKIEEKIMKQFQEHQSENPDWPVENFVSIAVRNCLYRMMQCVRMDEHPGL